jgi:hypothetical protein
MDLPLNEEEHNNVKTKQPGSSTAIRGRIAGLLVTVPKSNYL